MAYLSALAYESMNLAVTIFHNDNPPVSEILRSEHDRYITIIGIKYLISGYIEIELKEFDKVSGRVNKVVVSGNPRNLTARFGFEVGFLKSRFSLRDIVLEVLKMLEGVREWRKGGSLEIKNEELRSFVSKDKI